MRIFSSLIRKFSVRVSIDLPIFLETIEIIKPITTVKNKVTIDTTNAGLILKQGNTLTSINPSIMVIDKVMGRKNLNNFALVWVPKIFLIIATFLFEAERQAIDKSKNDNDENNDGGIKPLIQKNGALKPYPRNKEKENDKTVNVKIKLRF